MLTMGLLSLAGVVISVIVGSVWYSPITPMGRWHMQYLGFDRLTPDEQNAKIAAAKPGMPKIYIGQMVLSLLTAIFVVNVVTMSVQNGLPYAMAIVFPVVCWVCFVVPTVGSSILWGNCESSIAWKKFFSEIFCSLVTILLIALMTGLFI
ncbi:DUF1761 family protein [Patescibacteria group bacterium]|nr:DUF1761 family protein [Patescibacteria group bacterium]